MLPVAIIICVLLVLKIERMIYRAQWYKKLSVDIGFEERCVLEREPVRVNVRVSNQKRLPLPALSLIFSLPQNFRELRSNDVNIIDSWRRNELFALFSGQTAERTLIFQCEQRGIYRLSEYALMNRSFFLDETYEKKYPLDRKLFVYPSAVNRDRFYRIFQTLYGSILTNDFHYEDVFMLRGIREYQPFDSQKRINWAASAKLGNLMVNNYEYTTNRKVIIFLNLAMDQLAQERTIGEESIRLVKTWCMNLDASGIQCNIYTNGIDAETGKFVKLETEYLNKKYMEAVNETLTRIVIKDVEGVFLNHYAEEIEKYCRDYYFLFVSAYQHSDFQQELTEIAAKTKSFSWIIPVNNNSDFRPVEVLQGHAVAWDVYWRKERGRVSI